MIRPLVLIAFGALLAHAAHTTWDEPQTAIAFHLHPRAEVSQPSKTNPTVQTRRVSSWGPSVGDSPVPLSIATSVTEAALRAALLRSPWPDYLHDRVVEIALCEAPADTDFDGVHDGVNPEARGDSGRAWGVLQVRVDVHHRLARSLDLLTLREGLTAGYIIWLEAGRSFWPWSCA